MDRRNNKNKILYIFFFCLALLPSVAMAQTRLDMALPEIAGQPAPSEGLPAFINYIFVFGLGAIALLALAQMMIGGIEYVLAAGNVTKHEDAKDRIQQALIGLGVLLVSYLFLNTINPDLVNLRDPHFDLVEFKGKIPENMSIAEYLAKLEEKGITPSTDMTPKEKAAFAEKNKALLESPETKATIENMLQDLSSKPDGTSINLPAGYAVKYNDRLSICDMKCVDKKCAPNCRFEPLREKK